MGQSIADNVIAAAILGGGITTIAYAAAFGITATIKRVHPEEYQSSYRKVTRVLIYAASTGIVATVVMAFVLGAVAAAEALNFPSTSFEVADAPFVAIPLGLALSPILAPRITSWARHWILSALIMIIAVTSTVYLSSLK